MSRTILDEIAEKTKVRVEREQINIPIKTMCKKAIEMGVETGFPFETVLRKEKLSFICEVKKASPTKGLIVSEFPYTKIAREYEEAGADAISCLTEPEYFQGRNEYLKEITQLVNVPVLRKDFIIDEYMIYEAKVLGASAILLICSILNEKQLKEYVTLAHELGLSAVVEAYTEKEVYSAVQSGARIIGINNRDLKTFQVDINNSLRLREIVPKDRIFISESGIRTRQDIQLLEDIGVDGVLIGETLMREQDKKRELNRLRNI